MERSLKLYSLRYVDVKTYIFASLFIIGNTLLPQLFHSVPQGGQIWLPIYFFTLVGAYKFGWRVGLLTALLSPSLNYLIFGMPMLAMLPVLLCKSTVLAIVAGVCARHFKSVSVSIMLFVVLFYQVIGSICEWAILGDVLVVLKNLRISAPGIAAQVVGGYLFIKYLK